MEDDLLMKDLIPAKYSHLLYRDESPEITDFLILKYCEVYRYTKTELRLIIFSAQKCFQLQKAGLISDVWHTDDGLYLCTTSNANLDRIIALGASRRRIHRAGKTLAKLETLLAHKIIPYNPKLN